VFTDSGGDLHQCGSHGLKGWRFGGELGHSHPFEVRAIREVDEVVRVYQGADIARADSPPPPGQPTIEVPVALREAEREVPEEPEGMTHFGFNSKAIASCIEGLPDWGFTWDLQLIDDATRQPIGEQTVMVLLEAEGGGGIPTDSRGRLRLSLGGGLRQVVLRVPGYEPLEVETLGLDHGYAETTLALWRR
jgi:hypothetical protein